MSGVAGQGQGQGLVFASEKVYRRTDRSLAPICLRNGPLGASWTDRRHFDDNNAAATR